MILEFDKYKKLITPWPITVYGQTLTLQIELDLPKCACLQIVNSIQFDLYQKGKDNEQGKLLTFSSFNRIDDTTWGATIPFVGDELKEYISRFEEGTAILDGQFTFNIEGEKTITSQIFAVPTYIENTVDPGANDTPTVEIVEQLIDKALLEHAEDPFSHKKLFDSIRSTINDLTCVIDNKIKNITKLVNDSVNSIFNTCKAYTKNVASSITSEFSFDLSGDIDARGGVTISLVQPKELEDCENTKLRVIQVNVNNRAFTFDGLNSYIEYLDNNEIYIRFYNPDTIEDLESYYNGVFTDLDTKITVIYTVSKVL